MYVTVFVRSKVAPGELPFSVALFYRGAENGRSTENRSSGH